MAKLDELIKNIQQRVEALQEEEAARSSLYAVFAQAIQVTLRELTGKLDEDFSEVTVINFIILAAQEGYSASEISALVEQL